MFSADVERWGNVSLDGGDNNSLDWDTSEQGDWKNMFFWCPKCNVKLDIEEEQVREFLKDKDELQELVAEKISKIKMEKIK